MRWSVFGTVLSVLCTLLQIYVFWRLATVPFVRRHVRLYVLIGVGVLLWLGFVVGRRIGHDASGPLAATLEFVGMTWLATLFLLFLALAPVDLATCFGLLFRRRAPSLRGWALLVGLALSAIALFQGLRPPVVQRYEVRMAGLPAELDRTRLVAMSDTHLGSLIGDRWLAARVAQIDALRPDVIVLLGDIFEGHGPPPREMLAAMSRFHAPLGVWAVPGNHERYRGNNLSAMRAVRAIPMLRNCWQELRPGLILAGVEDLTSARRSGRGEDFVERALADRPAGATILLSHTPWQAAEAARNGVELMLSGHTHGGQIWPFGYLVRRQYPLLAGRYEVEGMTAIVCWGTGTWGPRMRLWRPSEILCVTLRAEKK